MKTPAPSPRRIRAARVDETACLHLNGGDMALWLNAIGYQAVWFCAVIGAGDGHWWPGVAAAAVFITWQWAVSTQRAADLRLVALALLCGVVVDGALAASDWGAYAASPLGDRVAPPWILAVWMSFAMTLRVSLAWLCRRPWTALAVGALGGPLAWLGAARGWQAVVFDPPEWRALALLVVAWALAMPLLAWRARRGVAGPVAAAGDAASTMR